MNFWRPKKREPLSETEAAAKRAENDRQAVERAQRAVERVEQRIAELEQAVRDENDQNGPGGPDDTASAVRVFLPERVPNGS
jgi:hypothetical protein